MSLLFRRDDLESSLWQPIHIQNTFLDLDKTKDANSENNDEEAQGDHF